VGNKIHSVSFSLKRGEILGVTGIIGAGGTELAKAIFADEGYKKNSGQIHVQGRETTIKNSGDAVRNRIALLTKDRKNEGLFLSFNVFENITIPSLRKFRDSIGLLSRFQQVTTAQVCIDKLRIKVRNPFTRVESLSGGNQQKVVISKWLEADPLILILDEPTVGIDIGAKFEIRKIIRDLASAGKGVILITSEYEDLESMCNRVLVMFKGRIVKELTGEQVNRAEIRKHLSGDTIQCKANT
jgi:ABC-type sugar transport system ATPase subunit